MKERKEKQVAVRFNVDLLEKLEKHARKEGRPLASFIRHIMQQEIQRREREELNRSADEWNVLKEMLGRNPGSLEQKLSHSSKSTTEERALMELLRLLRRFLQ